MIKPKARAHARFYKRSYSFLLGASLLGGVEPLGRPPTRGLDADARAVGDSKRRPWFARNVRANETHARSHQTQDRVLVFDRRDDITHDVAAFVYDFFPDARRARAGFDRNERRDALAHDPSKPLPRRVLLPDVAPFGETHAVQSVEIALER